MSANPIVPDLDIFEYRRLRDHATSECVKLSETTCRKKCYAAIDSGGLIKTVGLSAGGSGLPATNRLGLRANAA